DGDQPSIDDIDAPVLLGHVESPYRAAARALEALRQRKAGIVCWLIIVEFVIRGIPKRSEARSAEDHRELLPSFRRPTGRSVFGEFMDYSSQRVDMRRGRLLACENVGAMFGQVVERVLGPEPSETLFGEPQESQVRPDLTKSFPRITTSSVFSIMTICF